MRIVALEVQRFGCVKRARLELSPELNVLYGPNDIGKSTLVQAMRAALLLPHMSSTFKEFLPWQEPDATPEVVLTFEVEENGLPRFYRVHKRFGLSAHLAWSNDNRTYNDDTHKAREVDEKLRELLQWGVPAAGSRGMPESFLAKVLMASQPEVTGILGAALADDKDPSGKARILNAMQALLEDPLFKKVLQNAMDRVKTAYTASGRQRTGKGSPWIEQRDKVNEADQEVRRLQTLHQQSAAVIAKVRVLEEAVQEGEARLEAAKTELAMVNRRLEQQAALEVDRGRLEAARAALAEQTQKLTTAQQAQQRLEALAAELHTKQAEAEGARAGLEALRQQLAQAKERVRELESDDAARAVELQKSRLEARQTQLNADLAEQVRLGNQAQEAGKAHQAKSALEARVQKLEAEVKEAKTALSAQERESEQLRTEREQVRNVVRHFRCRELEAQLTASESAEREATEERQQAAEAKQQAEALLQTLAQAQLPTAPELEALRGLYRELEVGEAALDLGLTAVVTPDSPPMPLEIGLDDEVRQERLTEAARYTARETLRLTLPGATVLLTAAAATRVQELRARWREAGEPALKAARVSSLGELEAAVRDAAARQQEGQRLERAAVEHEATADKLAARSAEAANVRQALEEARAAITSEDLAELQKQADRFSSGAEAARAEQDLEHRLMDAERESSEARGTLQNSQAQLGAARTALATAERTYRDASSPLQDDWRTTLTAVVQAMSDVQDEKNWIEAELAALDASQNQELGAAQAELAQSTEACADAAQADEAAQQALSACKEALASQRARLELAQQAAAGLDLAAARQSLAQLERAFASAEQAFLAAGPPLGEAELSSAASALEQARAALEQTSRECLLARGGLIEVGGNVVEEELREAEAALEQQKRAQAELSIEYRAWQLLQDTLRAAEKSEATHLGEKLGAPLQKRFADLTGGRYRHIDLGTDLKTQGFSLAGELRAVTSLSTGTQEQLSTLFRLCLAEALETAVVLDDHLSQTDSLKMQWFREALEQVAQKAQVLVISCWPEHYQPAPGKIDTARKIDAALVVERY